MKKDSVFAFVMGVLMFAGCGEYREPDRIIEKDGRKARVYNDSEWIRQQGNYESMIPKGATDVRIYSDSTFGGSTCYIRCTVVEKDFRAFADEWGYKFEPWGVGVGWQGREGMGWESLARFGWRGSLSPWNCRVR